MIGSGNMIMERVSYAKINVVWGTALSNEIAWPHEGCDWEPLMGHIWVDTYMHLVVQNQGIVTSSSYGLNT